MADYVDGYWWNDDLRLHYRDYAGGADGRPAILCMAGLTRNVRDFENLANYLAPAWRVIAIDFRGRGESAYSKNPASYAPLIYALDTQVLIRDLNLDAFVAFGTSLGGLVTLLMAESEQRHIRGVLLNDVGPEVEAAGIARIRGYVGRSGNWPTWLHAARALATSQAHVYPDYTIDDWLAMAKRLYRLASSGRITIDYDARIAEPMRNIADQAPVDLWPTLEWLKGVPSLVLRGAISDVLAPATVDRMMQALPLCEAVTIPGVGHTPTLDEPEARAAIDRLLTRVLQG